MLSDVQMKAVASIRTVQWSLRLPSGDSIYRARGLPVKVVLASDLTFTVYGAACIALISGKVTARGVRWEEQSRGVSALGQIAREMLADCVLCVVRAHRYAGSPLSMGWIAREKHDVVRAA